MSLYARRGTVALDCWQYGEEIVADAVFRLAEPDFLRVCERAYALSSDFPDEAKRGMMLAKACALAAVEVVEGAARPLARGRRRIVGLPESLEAYAAEEAAWYRVPFSDRDGRRWPGVGVHEAD